MPNYLLEIGTEELPAGHVPDAQEKLLQLLSDALKENRLTHAGISTRATPRRLAAIVKDLQAKQETRSEKQKGPDVKRAFDADGKPNGAAIGFAGKWNLKVEDLKREEIGGSEYLVADVTIEGKTASSVLSEIMPRIIAQISGERLMRWGSSELKFSRPIRWIVSLLDQDVVEFQLEGMKAGRTTHGHRILSPGTINLKSVSEYEEALKGVKVLVDPAERRRVIEDQVKSEATKLNGNPKQLSGPLLNEVVNLTEWPCAVVGEFSSEYLDLPDTLIETIMVHHQRYFPIERAGTSTKSDTTRNTLLPYFITISNNDRKEARDTIKQGNERVIRARLADGRFFYFDDQKTRLSDRRAALEQLTFQEGLGSYKEKSERLVKLAKAITDALSLDAVVAICLERTADLCKLDLVTNLVRELPELQGYVGSWYAERDSEPPDVVRAIASHYAPRHTDDAIPQDTVGKLTSVIDKLDNIVGMFAIGKKPSGSSDPYALRRQAQGLVDIMVDGLSDYPVDVSSLIELIASEFQPKLERTKKGFEKEAVKAEVTDFLLQRLRTKLLDRGFKRETIEAALSVSDPLKNITDLIWRIESIEKLINRDGGLDLVTAGVRVGNIVSRESGFDVNESLFSEQAETELWEHFKKTVKAHWQGTECSADLGSFRKPKTRQQYEEILTILEPLVPYITRFFDKVTVNDPEQKKQTNRHAILMNIDCYFSSVADFRKMKPLLP